MKSQLKFYKDNLIKGEYKVELDKLVGEYMKSKWNNYDLPFERNFLSFVSETYSKDSFEEITLELWDSIYKILLIKRDLLKNELGV